MGIYSCWARSTERRRAWHRRWDTRKLHSPETLQKSINHNRIGVYIFPLNKVFPFGLFTFFLAFSFCIRNLTQIFPLLIYIFSYLGKKGIRIHITGSIYSPWRGCGRGFMLGHINAFDTSPVKCPWLKWPTQLLIQGQWWSIFMQHLDRNKLVNVLYVQEVVTLHKKIFNIFALEN